MLKERRITGIRYAPETDTLFVSLEPPAGPGIALPSPSGGASGGGGPTDLRTGQALLDADGHLVGIDLGGGHFSRTVFMAGPFERVARTLETNVLLTLTPLGEISGCRIEDAKEKVTNLAPNPYAPAG
jgi:hypothetical protein